MIERILSELLIDRFREKDLLDCFLVDVVSRPNDRVEVYIDSDSELTLKRCQIISRFLEKQIEENHWLGEKYTLEVSSPGTDRPLKDLRQYVKNIGRKIRIIDIEGHSIEGKLIDVKDRIIEVDIGKEKIMKIDLEKINKANILISFK